MPKLADRTSDINLPNESGRADPTIPQRASLQRQQEYFASERRARAAKPVEEKPSLNPLTRLSQRVRQLSSSRSR